LEIVEEFLGTIVKILDIIDRLLNSVNYEELKTLDWSCMDFIFKLSEKEWCELSA
jgi:hypothetical protein